MTLQMLGLVCDAVGVVILGWTASTRGPRQIAAQGGTHWNENKELIRALVKDTVDTATASVLLLVGFVIQIGGEAGIDASATIMRVGYGALGTSLALYYIFLRKVFAQILEKRTLRYIDKRRELK